MPQSHITNTYEKLVVKIVVSFHHLFCMLSIHLLHLSFIYRGSVSDYLLSNMDRWRQLIESAKASEAESGALIYTLILKLYVTNVSVRQCDYLN